MRFLRHHEVRRGASSGACDRGKTDTSCSRHMTGLCSKTLVIFRRVNINPQFPHSISLEYKRMVIMPLSITCEMCPL